MLKKLILLLLIPFFLCSCTKNRQDTISFASWGSVTEVGIIKNAISEFEKENPDIKIQFIHIPQNYFQKIHLMFASNTPPDVIFLNNLYLPVYAPFLVDVSNEIEKSEYYPQTLSGMSYKGKLYGIPRDISNLVFYVNTDKISLPDENWTINDLLEKCNENTDKNVFCTSYEDTLYWVLPYLAYFGGGILDKNLNLIIHSDKSIEGLIFYKNLKTKYHYAPKKSQIGSLTQAQMFLEGKILFYLSGRWMFPKISDSANFNWAVINFPYGESPQCADVSGWAIAKASKNKDSAMKFIKFLSNKNTSKYFTQTGLIVPARIDVSQNLNKSEHNEKAFLNIIEHSINTPVRNDYNKLTDKLNRELNL